MRGQTKPVSTLADVRDGGHGLEAICRYSGCRHRKAVDLDRLIQSVGGPVPLIPERAQPHFTDRMRCPACRRPGINLWLVPAAEKPRTFVASPMLKEPNYRVVNHGRHYPETFDMIATADNLFVAKGAYAAAAHFYADHAITLMQGALVIDDSRRDGQPAIMQAQEYKRMAAAERGICLLTQEELAALGPKAS